MASYVIVQQRFRLLREGLSQLLRAEDDIEVVGATAEPAELVHLCEKHRPDTVVLDIENSDRDAERLSVSLCRQLPGLRVIGITDRPLSTADVARARRCGIVAVISRVDGLEQILTAIRDTEHRVAPLRLETRPHRSYGSDAVEPVLTPRETTVLTFVGAGLPSKEIAVRLKISHKTVENHKQRIFRKLGVQNQAHAISVAMKTGLMRPERVMDAATAN